MKKEKILNNLLGFAQISLSAIGNYIFFIIGVD